MQKDLRMFTCCVHRCLSCNYKKKVGHPAMQWYLNRKNIFCLRQNRFPFEENYITFYYLITWSQIDILSHELHNQILFHHNLSFLFKNSFQPLNYLCWFVYIFYVWFCIIINSEQIHFLHFSNEP